jgi:hypothetical protein
MIEKWKNREVQFPSDMNYVQYATDTVNYHMLKSNYRILVYVGFWGSSSCKLQLFKWEKNIEKEGFSNGGSVKVLVFSQSNNIREIKYLLKKYGLNITGCIDKCDDINKLNSSQSEITFQTFLLYNDFPIKAIVNSSLILT